MSGPNFTNDTFTWNGGTGSFYDPNNWTDDSNPSNTGTAVPASGATVIFTNGAVTDTAVAAVLTVNGSITFDQALSGNSSTINGDLTLNGATSELGGSVLDNKGGITGTGALNFIGLSNSGTIDVQSIMVINLINSNDLTVVELSTETLTNTGAVTLAAGASLQSAGLGTVANSGILNLGTDSVVFGELANIGSITAANGASVGVSGTADLGGTITLGGGSSTVTFSVGGQAIVEPGTTIQGTAGSFGAQVNLGTVDVKSGGGINATGLSIGGTIESGGSVTGGSRGTQFATLTIAGNATATGSLDVAGVVSLGGSLEAQGSLSGPGTVAMAGGFLHLDAPDAVSGTVTNFAPGDTIDLKGIAPTSVQFAAGMLTFTGGGFALSVPGGAVHAASSPDGTAVTACFCAGTRILTESGEIAVEELSEGVHVVSLTHRRLLPVKWMGRRRIDCARHPRPEQVWPVCVAAGAFGDGAPNRDLWLSPDHAVFTDGRLVPARHLVNGASIVQVACGEVEYFHVELAEHAVLIADGLPAESYLDTGNRAAFANGGPPMRSYPKFAPSGTG